MTIWAQLSSNFQEAGLQEGRAHPEWDDYCFWCTDFGFLVCSTEDCICLQPYVKQIWTNCRNPMANVRTYYDMLSLLLYNYYCIIHCNFCLWIYALLHMATLNFHWSTSEAQLWTLKEKICIGGINNICTTDAHVLLMSGYCFIKRPSDLPPAVWCQIYCLRYCCL